MALVLLCTAFAAMLLTTMISTNPARRNMACNVAWHATSTAQKDGRLSRNLESYALCASPRSPHLRNEPPRLAFRPSPAELLLRVSLNPVVDIEQQPCLSIVPQCRVLPTLFGEGRIDCKDEDTILLPCYSSTLANPKGSDRSLRPGTSHYHCCACAVWYCVT